MAVLSLTTLAHAQECMGLKIKTGAGYEMTMYDSKDKATATMTYTFKNVRQEGASTVVDVDMLMTSSKGKTMPVSTIHYTCNGNEVVVDMAGMGGGASPMKDMEMKIVNNNISFPKTLSENTKLTDGTLETEAGNNGTTLMKMNIAVTNRKVEGKQSLTTPAGTFTVYKITSDIAMENRVMGMPIRNQMHSASYRANDVLYDIRTENFDKNGKLSSYSMLTKTF